MNEQIASHVVSLMIEMGGKLNESIKLVQETSSEDEFIKYRSSVGKLMGAMLLDIMNPIFDEHPNLKPDQLR